MSQQNNPQADAQIRQQLNLEQPQQPQPNGAGNETNQRLLATQIYRFAVDSNFLSYLQTKQVRLIDSLLKVEAADARQIASLQTQIQTMADLIKHFESFIFHGRRILNPPPQQQQQTAYRVTGRAADSDLANARGA